MTRNEAERLKCTLEKWNHNSITDIIVEKDIENGYHIVLRVTPNHGIKNMPEGVIIEEMELK